MSSVAKNYIFADLENKSLLITKDLENFNIVSILFHPTIITFHPEREDVVIAFGGSSLSSSATNNLYISYNFGGSWSMLRSNVQDFQWGWKPDQIFVLVASYFGLFNLYDLKEMTYDDGIQENNVISNVQGFELQGSFLFATKKEVIWSSTSPLNLFVSKNGSDFVQAEFPVIANYENKEYYIVDADEDRVMICVVHAAKSTHLYVSDVTGSKYTLSLPNVVYMSPTSVEGTSLPGLRYYSEPFADIHKVEGLRGIYIASQFLTNGSADANLADVNQTTRITYDKGGEWTHITAPYADRHGHHLHCYWFTGCTLHLLQDFLFGSSYRSAPILSSANAVGLVIGSGMAGYILSESTNPSIFLSTDAGFTWREVARGNYHYNFGDHGNLIVMVPAKKLTNTLLYSYDEGRNWTEYQFTSTSLTIYGLLTEPGSKTGNFSLWGSESGAHSWVIIHLNLETIFGGQICTDSDYKLWSPGISETKNDTCLLGEQEVVERKEPTSFCFNGRDYERISTTKICKCVRADYECDYGYILVNETEDLWNPQPSFYVNQDAICIRDYDVANISTSVPAVCPYGTTYTVTRGYRKIPGDVCENGYDHQFDPVNRKCPPSNKTDFLIYSTGTSIYKFDINLQQSVFLVSGSSVSEVYSVEFDYNRDILYWADQDTDSIMFYNLSSDYPRVQTLFSGNTGKVECISLDWESDNVYLVDSQTPKIEIFTTLTHWRRTIVTNNLSLVLENPRALEVFPAHGLMFWTDWSATNPRVVRATMAGQNITTIVSGTVTGNLHWPNGLALDFDAEIIYVIDGYNNKLLTCDLNGQGLKILVDNQYEIKHPFALAMVKDRLYWSDWTDNQVKSVYKADGQGFYTLDTGVSGRVMSLKGMTWDRQYKTNATGCGQQTSINGACSNICVPVPSINKTHSNMRVCICSEESKSHIPLNGTTESCHCHSSLETFNQTSGFCERNGGASSCGSDEFACSSDLRCIPSRWRCDRDSDCSDHSDEINCDAAVCLTHQFLCKINQRCISEDWICDGDNDCGDYSDEQDCGTTCNSNQFSCENGGCLPLSYRCDGEYDCGIGDQSDEQNCDSGRNTTCDSTQFKCNSTQYDMVCIPKSWQCDGVEDCDLGSDEVGCNSTCPNYQFKCLNSNRCIPRGWLCDYDNDCGDFSDERNCTYTTSVWTPVSTTPRTDCICNTSQGGCVTFDAYCDGFRDCPNGEDEWACSLTTTEAPRRSTTTCNGFHCSDGTCLPPHKVCDNHADCQPFWEDELNCDCTDGRIPCAASRRQCIYASQVCDGLSQCFGGTDELYCNTNSTTAQPPDCHNQFQCVESGVCIAKKKECDGRYDCPDGSDESTTHCNSNISVSHLQIVSKNATTASFSWSVSSHVTAHVIYVVEYILVVDIQNSDVNGTAWAFGVNSTKLSATVSKLEPYTNYQFRVRASISNGQYNSESAPSNIVRLSTLQSPPGIVGRIAIRVDDSVEIVDGPTHWLLSWQYPQHPYGIITRYQYNISIGHLVLKTDTIYAKGTDSVSEPVDIPQEAHATQMNISVVAFNAAGMGARSSVTHCLTLTTPTSKCAQSGDGNVTLSIHVANISAQSDRSSSFGLLLTYQDENMALRRNRVPVNKSDDYSVTIPNLSSGTKYDINIALEKFLGWPGLSSMPICTSAVDVAQCTTTGSKMDTVNHLKIAPNVTTNYAFVSWQPVSKATEYEVVLAYDKEDLEEGKYVTTVTVSTAFAALEQLYSCKKYFVAVRVISPGIGKLSTLSMLTTLADDNAAPRLVHAALANPSVSLNLHAIFHPDYNNSDSVDVKISWEPPCYSSHNATRVYIRERNIDYIHDLNRTVKAGDESHELVVKMQRGGSYEIVIQEGLNNGKNSSTLSYSPAPYKRPHFQLYIIGNDIQFDWAIGSENRQIGASPWINMHYSENGSDFHELGTWYVNTTDAKVCRLPSIKPGYNYTIKMRFVRPYQNRYYYGKFGYASILSTITKASTAGEQIGGPGNKTGLYVGVSIAVLVALVLSVLLSVWCVRHRRLQRSFLDFTSSHYNTRTDNATFSNDEDSPMIQGFSDDEPLVLA
ncbi:sortilin-related receptor-like [Watersipora subatra]|uniref:sortilin-related receptor-like n=1 Tax=Watersipora subatra TaxID=2589382 RepID=UPI00355AE4EB